MAVYSDEVHMLSKCHICNVTHFIGLHVHLYKIQIYFWKSARSQRERERDVISSYISLNIHHIENVSLKALGLKWCTYNLYDLSRRLAKLLYDNSCFKKTEFVQFQLHMKLNFYSTYVYKYQIHPKTFPGYTS
jgi:hypothetical protein